MIKRYYTDKIASLLSPNRALVIYGPRQVGKTTLVQNFLKTYKGKVYNGAGENADLRSVLESSEFSRILPFFRGYDLIVIDEAQKIEDIGQGLKIIIDHIDGIRIIATGSSSFDLSNKIGEPLVGRQRVIRLYPLSVGELVDAYGAAYMQENLRNLLVFGFYPEAVTAPSFDEKEAYLLGVRDSYLYRDILELGEIRNSKKILDLLRLLAFQVGKEVSVQELGSALDMSKNTVERYLDLLEKSFVLINVRGFSRNLRKEVTKTSRYYFYDIGIRNAVIDNFHPVENRDDIGALWENFLFIERMKRNEYKQVSAHYYFWRTWDRKEIDLVEERGGKLFGYEFKWSPQETKPPKDWIATYENAVYQTVHRDNYLDFVL